jgi:ubiquinone/menaquinone biosynthesis C-methylase UbiE
MSSSTIERGVKDQWQDDGVARKYLNAENATRPYAKILVDKSGLKDGEESYVLDLACGTGAVVQEIYDAVPKEKWDGVKVYGGDVSSGMVEYLQTRGKGNGWSGLTTGIVDGNVSSSNLLQISLIHIIVYLFHLE